MTDSINAPGNRTSASFCICTYNQEQYVRDAILAALAQTYEPLEVIVSDDCSSDATFDIIQECARDYAGPHKLIINRNSQNLGLIKHVNKVLAMASGQLIVGAAGDDVSLPTRTAELVSVYEKSGRGPVLLHGDVIEIDSADNVLGIRHARWGRDKIDLHETALSSALYTGASSAFSRELIESFPPISHYEAYEDLIWGFRAALVGRAIFVDRPLVKYRSGVGVSWKLHHTLSDHPIHVLETDQKKRRIMLAVLRQRLLDISTVKPGPEMQPVKSELKSQIVKQSILFDINHNPVGSTKWLLRHPIRYHQGIRSALKRRKRLQHQYEQKERAAQ